MTFSRKKKYIFKSKPGIYLISPSKINMKIFPSKLSSLLETGIVKIFQLRLKGYNDKSIIEITKDLYQICRHYNVVFILNDRPELYWGIIK